jgi:hypothetical protein
MNALNLIPRERLERPLKTIGTVHVRGIKLNAVRLRGAFKNS